MATESSSINGVDYSNACEALHTFKRLFAGAELQQVRELAHRVHAMFGVEQPAYAALSDEELSRIEKCALTREYDEVKELGSGVYARAWQGRSKLDNKIYALKLIEAPVANTSPAAAAATASAIASMTSGTEDSTKKWEEHFVEEARIMAKLEHPNLVRYYSSSALTYERAQWLCIRMQLYERSLENWFDSEMDRVGDLMSISSTHIKCLALSNRRMRIIVDVLHGLQFIHQNRLVHGDLHYGNVFLEQKTDGIHAVIGDFGRSGAYENSGNLQSSSIHDVGTFAAERVTISGTVTKSRVKKSKLRHQTTMQNKSQKYNPGLDMQRFGEIYLQIRYLQDFDFDCPEDRELALHSEYLLESDAHIRIFLAHDWTDILWRCENILEENEFHALENQFSTNHKNAQRVAPDLMHWETSMIPLLEETGAGRPIGGLQGLDVRSAVADEKSLVYLLCYGQSPHDSVESPNDSIFSIHQVDLSARDLNSSQLYEEEPNVSLDGLFLCRGQLVSLRKTTELLIVEASFPKKKVIAPIYYYEDFLVQPAQKEQFDKHKRVLTNGPDSIIFIAMFSIFDLDISQMVSSESAASFVTPTQDELRRMRRVEEVSAMCYVRSERELLVACVSDDRELSTIFAFSYSHENGLELMRTAGSLWSCIDNLQPIQCGHLVLNARSHSDCCFEKPACNRHSTELIASNPMCGSTGCVQLGVCAFFNYSEHSLKCWILSNKDSSRDDNVLCTSSVSYIEHKRNTRSDMITNPVKYAVRTLKFSHFKEKHLA